MTELAAPTEAEIQECMHVLDKYLVREDMEDWERSDRSRWARYRAERVLNAGYRRLAVLSPEDGRPDPEVSHVD